MLRPSRCAVCRTSRALGPLEREEASRDFFAKIFKEVWALGKRDLSQFDRFEVKDFATIAQNGREVYT